jgi:hypothetical protein
MIAIQMNLIEKIPTNNADLVNCKRFVLPIATFYLVITIKLKKQIVL